MKLHQLIAIVKDAEKKADQHCTHIYKELQKKDLYEGLSKTFEPVEEEGYVYPPEKKPVQRTVVEDVQDFLTARIAYHDLCATQDLSNTEARSDVVVDGEVVLRDVPVTTLLFLEKQLQETLSVFKAIPVLDPAEKWSKDPNTGLYKSDPKGQHRSKKITDFQVVVQPTPQHRAEVKEVSKDVIEGTWTTVKFSGAIPQTRKTALVDRVEKLITAVKVAREGANGAIVSEKKIGQDLVNFLTFGLQ